MNPPRLRLGRIGYLNVLPIYHPLEAGWIEHGFTLTYGPPAELNRLIRGDGLDLSSVSSIEYARHPERYLLLPDLAIGSQGPVKSVLLLSRVPMAELKDKSLLVTAETHTSAALLRIVLERVYGVRPAFVPAPGSVRQALAAGADQPAVLAIGDEALSLRYDPRFPYQLDLGEVWRDWTGLPFVFGVWVARRQAVEADPAGVSRAAEILVQAKKAGVAAIEEIIDLTAKAKTKMTRHELRHYYTCLCYDLGPKAQEGLRKFFDCLVEHQVIPKAPPLELVA